MFDNAIYPVSVSTTLLEQVSDEKPIETSSLTPCRRICESTFKELTDCLSNAVVALATETATAGYGALIFCRSRQRCQVTALLVSRAMPANDTITEDVLDRRKEIIGELRNSPTGVDDDLAQTVMRGVAFHREPSTEK